MNAAREWPKILQFGTDAVITERLVEQHYRKLAPKYHPDLGGSTEDMQQLNQAKELALEWIAKERKRQALAKQQAEAAHIAAQQAASTYQQAFYSQMAQMQNMYSGLGNWAANAQQSSKPYEPPPPPAPKISRWKKILAHLKGAK